jgi:hypothetical protein
VGARRAKAEVLRAHLAYPNVGCSGVYRVVDYLSHCWKRALLVVVCEALEPRVALLNLRGHGHSPLRTAATAADRSSARLGVDWSWLVVFEREAIWLLKSGTQFLILFPVKISGVVEPVQ